MARRLRDHPAAAVFVVAVGLWWIEALVIPLAAGRDLGTYLGDYVQLFWAHPIDLGYVLGRTPIASLFAGGLLQFAGGALAEPAVSLLYGASITAWFAAARHFGDRAAWLVTAVLVVYPGYTIIFHELSSDAVFAAAFAGWALLVVRVFSAPAPAGWAAVGAGVGVLALIRPGSQPLLALVLIPLLLPTSTRTRLVGAAAFLIPAVVLLGGWALHNGLRYDNYTVARGGNATVPFYRTFVTDRIVEPSNGPKTRELADAVQRDLLPKEPYRSYGITLHDFFSDASSRMEVDLLTISDRTKGWHSNYSWLRDVGIEAVKAHPFSYARGVASSTWGLLHMAVYRTPSSPSAPASATTASAGGTELPKPSEGEPIPSAHEGGVSTPDGSIYTVWTSPTEHHLVFVHPGDEQRYDRLHRKLDDLARNLPDRGGSASLERRLNQASKWFPPPVLWLLLGLVALTLRRPRNVLGLLVPTLAALVVIVVTALGLPAEPHYSVPVAPGFILLAGAAVFAPRRVRSAEAVSWRSTLRVLGQAAGIIAAAWAVKVYAAALHGFVAHDRAGHDLAVFLHGAGRVLHWASPYGFRGDETYAYPPLLAFLVAPLHPLGAAAAAVVWTLLSLAAIGVALWLLGLRDWRCYTLTAVFPFTRSAIDLGTVAPLLLLAVAVAWRWRDTIVRPAVAIGAAVALKLYLWPLAVWLGVTRRFRAAVASVACCAALVLLPWAVLGFKGLGGYPGLLHRLSDEEATSSYSIVALSVRAHLPESLGVAISIVVALALLAAAAWLAREGDAEVAVLTLAVAATLAASPIVWVHYFLLLLVPLALVSPQLSLLWFVPFAYYPLGESAWPAGDATKLAIALVTTLVLLSAALWPRLKASRRPAVRSRRADALL
ncbi:MAG TPA: glycosyltransferase family 87 protein [Gaiellaceae bacterium]|nr:glycosyltransferase family 87 protein [Gaiellaceae bacterium]